MKWLLTAASLAATALAVALLVTADNRAIPQAVAPNNPASAALTAGKTRIAIIVVSSTCGHCRRQPDLDQLVGIKDKLLKQHDRPWLHGVSIDTDPHAGLDILNEYGRFDELSVGGGAANTALLQYLWQDSSGYAGVPQLIVLERQVAFEEAIPGAVSVTGRVLDRAVGLSAMSALLYRWVNNASN